MKPKHLEQLRRFVELQQEQDARIADARLAPWESFYEAARQLPIAELLAELESLHDEIVGNKP